MSHKQAQKAASKRAGKDGWDTQKSTVVMKMTYSSSSNSSNSNSSSSSRSSSRSSRSSSNSSNNNNNSTLPFSGARDEDMTMTVRAESEEGK